VAPKPDEDALYRWVHQQWFSKKTGGVSPTFFKNAPDPPGGRQGMSTDWSRYSTPEESRRRARIPALNGVIELRGHFKTCRAWHHPVHEAGNPGL
jgi:hypothetical protein